MASHPRSLSDDWEEVPDDNFSVVSLPTSDDATDTDEPPVHLATPASPIAVVSHRLASLTIYDDAAPPTTAATAESHSETEQNGKDTQYAHEKQYVKDSQYLEEAHDVPRPDTPEHTELNDMLDIDIDPEWLHKVTTSLIKLITEILDAITFHSNADLPESTRHIRDECDLLRRHLRSLEPILKGYSKHWDPKRATVTLPIDPGLYEWMSGLRVELLGVEALVQNQLSISASSSNKAAASDDLTKHHTSLVDFSSQIAGFMPIMQADYNEFHTANLPLVNSSRDTTATPSTTQVHGFRGNGPNGLFHLKRELYALKDQLSTCLEELQKYMRHEPPCDNKSVIEELLASYRIITNSLGMILSNHASDWIEYGLAGGMTYPEFCRLNPDTISSLNLQLKDVVRNLSEERLRLTHLRYTDSEFLLDDGQLETRASDIDALRAIEEVLIALLQVRK